MEEGRLSLEDLEALVAREEEAKGKGLLWLFSIAEPKVTTDWFSLMYNQHKQGSHGWLTQPSNAF